MDNLFLLLSLVSIIALVIGLIKPELVVRWGNQEKKNRKSVLKVYGLAIIAFFILFSITTPSSNNEEVAEAETELEENIDNDEEVEEDKLESVSLAGEIYKKDDISWTEEFRFIDKEGNEYKVISNDDVPEEYMQDGLIYRVIGEKEADKITLKDYEVLADNWEAYEKKQAKEEEIKDIEKTIKDRVSDEYSRTVIKKIDINENLGTDDEDDYIVLPHLKWDVKNKPKMTREMLEMYSDDLAATLAKHTNITEITIFWEVPYHLEGNNVAKMSYSRSGDGMAIGEKWYDPLIRE